MTKHFSNMFFMKNHISQNDQIACQIFPSACKNDKTHFDAFFVNPTIFKIDLSKPFGRKPAQAGLRPA